MGRQIGALLIATAALSLASCGSGGGGGGGGGGGVPIERDAVQITRARLIERGDAICRRDVARASTALARLPGRAPSGSIYAILVSVLEIREEAVRTGAERIAELGTPAADAAKLDRYLEERASAAYSLRQAIAAAKQRDTPKVNGALRAFRRNEADKAAKRFGFKVCGLGAGRAKR